MSDPHDILYRDRRTGQTHRETVLGEKWVRWAYQDGSDTSWRSWLFRHALPSRVLGWYFDSGLSRGRIRPTIQELAIDPAEFRDTVDSYGTFNAFFTRHLKPEARPWDPDPALLAAPADGRYLVYDQLDGDAAIPVKGARFSVAELLGRDDAGDFAGGAVIVARLCPADYHRYHFPCAGHVAGQWPVDGAYHSVNPIALRLGLRVFQHNRRDCCLLDSPQFGRVAIIEVGAFGVGSIVQTYSGTDVAKMDEKGYFAFGGSTQVLAFQAGRLQLDADLVEASHQGIETLIKVGETIGRAAGS